MSNEASETISDIVAEMRNEGNTDASFLEWVGAKILRYADRIDAAAKRQCSDCLGHRVYDGNDDLDRLRKENDLLRAALKPVLGIVIPTAEYVDSNDECECRWCVVGDTECWRGRGMTVMGAVREAQRIYNGGGESEVK